MLPRPRIHWNTNKLYTDRCRLQRINDLHEEPPACGDPLGEGASTGAGGLGFHGKFKELLHLTPLCSCPPSHQHTAGSTVPPASLWLLEGWWLPPASAELQQEAPICPTPMGPVHPYLHIKHLQKPSEQNPSLSWGTLLPALAFALPDLAGHSGRKILTQLPQ